MSLLQSEIRQGKSFESIHEELWLNLSRTAAVVSLQVEHQLRPYGLSPTQYNVMRILRGAGPEGLVQHEVGARLVAQVPDVPRILSRMEKAGWVLRVRGTADRRVVRATLTESGLRLVDALDDTMRQVHLNLFPAMTEDEMRHMCDLLTLARGGDRN
jgi:DNA-binding MarR family transcriptional regulator